MTDDPLRGPDEILEDFARQYGVRVSDLTSNRQYQHLSTPRGMVAWELRYQNGWSLSAIGELLGGRHHSSVIHLLNKLEEDR